MRAYIVVDLGFGDAGKGLLTDFLVRQSGAKLVIRYNGGAQAGHNVVTNDGNHHTFSQFGSGTFIPHVKTYLSRHVVVHPTAMLVEGDLLERKGVQDPFSRIRVSDQALVITPFHQAANRIREIARGEDRHGSCGVGVGEAVEDALLHPANRIRAGDLYKPSLLRKKLQALRDQKRAQLKSLYKEISTKFDREFEFFEQDNVIDNWISSVSRLTEFGLIVDDSVLEEWLQEAGNVVFEGAQGVLLDEDAGFHPYTTWSRCTSANALEIINEAAPFLDVFRIGVMRSFAVRHGPGPFPTETNSLASFVSEHNKFNEWQREIRYGWFDAVLARYSLEVTGGVDTLMITHMDMLSYLNEWKYCVGYQSYHDPHGFSVQSIASNGTLTDFRLPLSLPLAQRANFTEVLSSVTPVLEACDTSGDSVIQKIELLTGQTVGIVSHGPTAGDVQLLEYFPS